MTNITLSPWLSVTLCWPKRRVCVRVQVGEPDAQGVRHVTRVEGHERLRLRGREAVKEFGGLLASAAVAQWPQETGGSLYLSDSVLRLGNALDTAGSLTSQPPGQRLDTATN